MLNKLGKFLIVLSLIGLSGCARVWALHYNEREITLCGNAYAGHEDFKEKADRYCGGTSAFKEGFLRQTGHTYSNNEVRESVQRCVTFTCVK